MALTAVMFLIFLGDPMGRLGYVLQTFDLRSAFILSMLSLVLAVSSAQGQPGDFLSPPPPDYYQVRTGLPATIGGISGGAYCGPTVGANLLKWMNWEGYSFIGAWPEYEANITEGILSIGVAMNTDPDDGTSIEGFRDGLQDILDGPYSGDFLVTYYGRGSTDSHMDELGRDFDNIVLALEGGGLVTARIGWYMLPPDAPTGDGRRCSGHYVTITGYDGIGGIDRVRFLDPARDIDCIGTGSPCVCRWSTSLATLTLQNEGQALTDPFPTKQASVWGWLRSGNTCSSMEARTPVQDGFFVVDEVSAFSIPADPSIYMIMEYNLTRGLINPYAAVLMEIMTSIAFFPMPDVLYFCGPDVNSIFRTDMITDIVSPFVTEVPVFEPLHLVAGGQGLLYVLHSPIVPTVSGSKPEPGQTALDSANQIIGFRPDGTVHSSVSPTGVGTFTYHEKTDHILWWNGQSNTLQVYSSDLQHIGQPMILPPVGNFSNPSAMIADPNGPVLYYNHDGSDLVYRYNLATRTALPPISDPEMTDPAGMVVDDRGHLYVVQDMISTVLHFDPAGNRVFESSISSFAAKRVIALNRKVRRQIIDSDLASDLDNDPFNEDLSHVGFPPERGGGVLDFSLFPNPFNPTTQIRFELQAPAAVSLQVFDASGRLLRTLIGNEIREAGVHHVYWDGKDNSSRSVGSGIYFGRLRAGSSVQTERMVLLR